MNRRSRVFILSVGLLLCLGIATFYWTDGFSYSMGSVQTRSDSSKTKSEDHSSRSDKFKGTPFEQVVSLGTGSLPLRSQHAVAAWQGGPLTVFTDGGYIYVADMDGERYQVTPLTQTSGSPTIAASEDRVVLAWVTPTAIMASSTTDLKTWTEPTTVGTREQDGGPIPSIDWTGSEFAVVWVDAPKTNESTGAMDGVGTLQLATGDGLGDWTVESINETAAIVSIAGSTIVWRDDRDEPGSRFDTVYMLDIYEDEEVVVVSGYDPAVAVDGDDIAIGYHLGAEAHLRTSVDGGATWTDTVLDSTGKFVAPLVSNGVFGAVWVDYTTAEAARDARDNSGHRTTAIWDEVTYLMNGGDAYTLQGQGTVIYGAPVSVYQVDGEIFLAR